LELELGGERSKITLYCDIPTASCGPPGHYKILDPKYDIDGNPIKFTAAEVHFNRVPGMGLGTSYYMPSTWVSSILHFAVDGHEHMSYMIPRNIMVNIFEEFYKMGIQYHVY
jgi:hypothetical protein